MKMIMTAGALCAALLIVAVSTVHAKTKHSVLGGSVTPIVINGE